MANDTPIMILVSHQIVFNALGVAERTQANIRFFKVGLSVISFHYCHLVNKACAAGVFVDKEEYITNIDADILAN